MTMSLPVARAAVVTTLAGAALAMAATPAAAAPPTIRIEKVSAETVKSGGTVRVRFRATNNARGAETVFVAVSGGLQCTAGCSTSRELGPGRSASFSATLVAPRVGEGQQSGRNLAVSVRVGTQTAFDHRMIIVSGAGEQPSAPATKISGRVRDTDGKAVGGARVTVEDSAGHEYRTTSDRGGRFAVRSSDRTPIAAGAVTVAASKDGYRTARTTVQGSATVRLTLAAAATKSSPSPTPAFTAETPAAVASVAAAPPPATRQISADGGNGSLWFTLLGGLMVAGGAGALALMLIRRRRRAGTPVAAEAPTAILPVVPHR